MANKKGAGRPALTELEKFQRKVKRAKLKLDEMKIIADLEKKIGEEELPKKRGRVPMNAQQKFEKEQVKFESIVNELRKQEKDEGVDHCDLDAVEDSSVDEIGMSKVGKPKADLLSKLDHSLLLLQRELEAAEKMEDIVREAGAKGRPAISQKDRVRRAKIKILSVEAKILEAEKDLDDLGIQHRKVKKLRDKVRIYKRKIKLLSEEDMIKFSDHITNIQQRILDIEEIIENEEIRLNYLQKLKDTIETLEESEDKLNSIKKAKGETEVEQIKALRKQKIIQDELNKAKLELESTF